jgi:hypothetical protein
MRAFIIGLITLGTILTSKHADAQLIRFGDINPQPAFMPLSGYNSMPMNYYSGYSSMAYSNNSMNAMNQRMLDNMVLSNMMLSTNDVAPLFRELSSFGEHSSQCRAHNVAAHHLRVVP